MPTATLFWLWSLLFGPDVGVDFEEQEAEALNWLSSTGTLIGPDFRLAMPRENFYHCYDHRSTLAELLTRFPDPYGNNWRSQFRFDPL